MPTAFQQPLARPSSPLSALYLFTTTSPIDPAASHIITMQIRLACGKARVKSPPAPSTLHFAPRHCDSPLRSIPLLLLLLPRDVHSPPSPSAPLPSHICKTRHYYNNITPMNLPLNMRYASVDCIANYVPGGTIRTSHGLRPHSDFKGPHRASRVFGPAIWCPGRTRIFLHVCLCGFFLNRE